MENKKYYITDIETGYKTEVTQEQHETYMTSWELFRPKITGQGKPIITGTSGELDSNYQDMFYKLQS